MGLDFDDALRGGVPLALFVIAVTLLVRYWPRPPKVFLTRERKRAQIIDVKQLSHDTKRFRLSLGSSDTVLGLPAGKHVVVYAPNPPSCLASGTWNGEPDPDKGRPEITRPYTPVSAGDAAGFFDLVVKVYRPGAACLPDGGKAHWADGGKASAFLDSKAPGDYVDVMGPMGIYEYLGQGMFRLPGRTVSATHVGMLAGGTGLTPMLQVLQAALRDKRDRCSFTLVYANKTEDDILCRGTLDDMARRSDGRLKVAYTLDLPPEKWKHKVGFITASTIREHMPPPSKNTLILMCGPPPMVELACKKNLEILGYPKTCMVTF